MKYLLDTDICIYLIKKKPSSVISKLSSLDNSEVALSTVSLFELKFGVEGSNQFQKSSSALNMFCASIPAILPFDSLAVNYAAKIRSDLKIKGTSIGPYDLLIAAIARSNDLILVSNNLREFNRVEGLRLESWV
jgi:tRNA(fMet)-specific endonuclease VapC